MVLKLVESVRKRTLAVLKIHILENPVEREYSLLTLMNIGRVKVVMVEREGMWAPFSVWQFTKDLQWDRSSGGVSWFSTSIVKLLNCFSLGVHEPFFFLNEYLMLKYREIGFEEIRKEWVTVPYFSLVSSQSFFPVLTWFICNK